MLHCFQAQAKAVQSETQTYCFQINNLWKMNTDARGAVGQGCVGYREHNEQPSLHGAEPLLLWGWF